MQSLMGSDSTYKVFERMLKKRRMIADARRWSTDVAQEEGDVMAALWFADNF